MNQYPMARAITFTFMLSAGAAAWSQDAETQDENPVTVVQPDKTAQTAPDQRAGKDAADDERVSALQVAATLKVKQVAQLLLKFDRAMESNTMLRRRVADAELQLATVQRELAELKRFMEDHDAYGRDFIQYRGVKEIAEREVRREAVEKRRQQYEEEQVERRRRRQELNVQKQAQRAEDRREHRYSDAGFDALGQDIYLSAMSYQYKQLYLPDDGLIRTRGYTTVPYYPHNSWGFGYQPFLNYYWYRPKIIEIDYDWSLDYTAMTLSGSVLNASSDPRRIGIAIVFFDDSGHQIGGDTVEIADARTDVPYPFTLQLTMSQNQPFYSYRINVLYSDPIPEGAGVK